MRDEVGTGPHPPGPGPPPPPLPPGRPVFRSGKLALPAFKAAAALKARCVPWKKQGPGPAGVAAAALFVFSASLPAREPQKWFHFNKYLLCSVLIFFKTEASAPRAPPGRGAACPRPPARDGDPPGAGSPGSQGLFVWALAGRPFLAWGGPCPRGARGGPGVGETRLPGLRGRGSQAAGGRGLGGLPAPGGDGRLGPNKCHRGHCSPQRTGHWAACGRPRPEPACPGLGCRPGHVSAQAEGVWPWAAPRCLPRAREGPTCPISPAQVSGRAALQGTTLQSLGLTGGSATLRSGGASGPSCAGGGGSGVSKERGLWAGRGVGGAVDTEARVRASLCLAPRFAMRPPDSAVGPEPGVSRSRSPASPAASLSAQQVAGSPLPPWDSEGLSRGDVSWQDGAATSGADPADSLGPKPAGPPAEPSPTEPPPPAFVPFSGWGQRLGGPCGSARCPPSPRLPKSFSSPGGPSKPKKSRPPPEPEPEPEPVSSELGVGPFLLTAPHLWARGARGSEPLSLVLSLVDLITVSDAG